MTTATPRSGPKPAPPPARPAAAPAAEQPPRFDRVPMTGAQSSYLKTLSDQAGEPFDEQLSKADASKRIDELQEKTGRGR